MAVRVPKPEATDVPLVAYAAASAVLWSVFFLAADWALGDLVTVGRSMLKGAVIGFGWGLVMHPFERCLKAHREKRDRLSSDR